MAALVAALLATQTASAEEPLIGTIDVMPQTGLYTVTFHENDADLRALLAAPPAEARAQCMRAPVALRPDGGVWTLRSLSGGGYAVAARARCTQSGPLVTCDTGRRYTVIAGGTAGFALASQNRLRVFHACTGPGGLWPVDTPQAQALDAAEDGLTGG